MKNTSKILLAVVGVVVVVLVVVLVRGDSNQSQDISSFTGCVEAGNPVMESDPRQCRTDDGQLFVEGEGQSDSPDNTAATGTVTVDGELQSVDASSVPVDGPYVIELATEGNETQTVEVPSMGINLCEADINIDTVLNATSGQAIAVRGDSQGGGSITPCESADHFLEVAESNEVILSVGETDTVNGLDITLDEVVQESRCPADSECIEGGAITVRVTLANGESQTVNIASDDVPYSFGDHQVSISGINPPLLSETEIAQDEYRIEFKVE
jgi:hypothetical protein